MKKKPSFRTAFAKGDETVKMMNVFCAKRDLPRKETALTGPGEGAGR